MTGRGPERDDTVLPLPQERPGVSFQWRRGGRRGVDLRVVGCQLEHGVTTRDDVQRLRPAVALTGERDGNVRLHGVIPWTQSHVGGAIHRRDDPAGRGGLRVVADQEGVTRHRRRLPLSIQQDDFDMKDAKRLAGRGRGDGKKRRQENQPAEHQDRSRRHLRSTCSIRSRCGADLQIESVGCRGVVALVRRRVDVAPPTEP